MTKNPCLAAGDVRVFEAVDIPDLHHLCDTLVFSQNGPRPNMDELAGADADGDEFVAIWEPSLLLEKNEKAFDFINVKNKQNMKGKNMVNIAVKRKIKNILETTESRDRRRSL